MATTRRRYTGELKLEAISWLLGIASSHKTLLAMTESMPPLKKPEIVSGLSGSS